MIASNYEVFVYLDSSYFENDCFYPNFIFSEYSEKQEVRQKKWMRTKMEDNYLKEERTLMDNMQPFLNVIQNGYSYKNGG